MTEHKNDEITQANPFYVHILTYWIIPASLPDPHPVLSHLQFVQATKSWPGVLGQQVGAYSELSNLRIRKEIETLRL